LSRHIYSNFGFIRIGYEAVTLRTLAITTLALTITLLLGCNGSGDDSVTLEYAKGPLTQAGVTSSLSIEDDWGTGFCGSVSVVNKGRRPIRNWQLVLQRNGADFGRKWSGLNIESPKRVVVSPNDHNSSIPVGGTVSVPFCGSGTGRPALQSMSVDTGDA
jgi:cellulase/cellobiase CelA1